MKYPKIISFIAFMATVLVGCLSGSQNNITPTHTLDTSNNTEKTLFVPGTTAKFSTTGTKEPNAAIVITASSATAMQVYQSVTPIGSTAVPLDALTKDEQHALILNLLADNGGCQLPCIWGVNSADVESAYLLADMVPVNYVSGHYWKDFDISFPVDNQPYNLASYFFIINNEKSIGIDSSIISKKEKCIMYGAEGNCDMTTSYWDYEFDTNNFRKITKQYLPGEILLTYGMPKEISINGWFYDPDEPQLDWYPFSIMFSYEDKGFLAEYLLAAEVISEGNHSFYHVCTDIGSFIILTWGANGQDINGTSLRVGEWFSGFEIDRYRPLDSVTSLSDEEFTQHMIENSTLCFSSPTDHWNYLWWLPDPDN